MSNFEKKLQSVAAAALLSMPGSTSENILFSETQKQEQETTSVVAAPQKFMELKKTSSYKYPEQVQKERINFERSDWRLVFEKARADMDQALYVFERESLRDPKTFTQIDRMAKGLKVQKLSDLLEGEAIVKYVKERRTEKDAGKVRYTVRFAGDDNDSKAISEDDSKRTLEYYRVDMSSGISVEMKLENKDKIISENPDFEGNIFSFVIFARQSGNLPDVEITVSVELYESGYSGHVKVYSNFSSFKEDPKNLTELHNLSYTNPSVGIDWFTYYASKTETVQDKEGDYISGHIKRSGEDPMARDSKERHFSSEVQYESDALENRWGVIEILDFTEGSISYPKITLEKKESETDTSSHHVNFSLYVDSNTEPLAEIQCNPLYLQCRYLGYGNSEEDEDVSNQIGDINISNEPVDLDNNPLEGFPRGDQLFELIERTVPVIRSKSSR